MRRYSTPTHTFTTDVDLSLAQIYITYKQWSTELTKTNDDLIIDETGRIISLKLTQEETAMFRSGTVNVQVRYIMPDGTTDESDIVEIDVDETLFDKKIPL